MSRWLNIPLIPLLLIALASLACEVGPPAGGMVELGDFAIDVYEYPNRRRAMPKHNVSFYEAQAACGEQGKRLCTLWEWQRACMGAKGRRFPYGETYNDALCHTATAIQGHTSTGVAAGMARSGTYKDCKSEDGVYDLSGNLEEWVDGYHNGERGILMGGAWYTYDEYTDCTGLYSQSPMYRMRPKEKVFSAGFRCCSGPPVSEEDLRAWAMEIKAAETAFVRAKTPNPEGMIPMDGFEIDRYEYPNREGVAPMVHVTWEQSRQLCAAVGKRLCSADEWESACRSSTGGGFPYGDTWQRELCNTSGAGPAVSGAFPQCKSGAGALDMSGNVWEWTAERIDLGADFGEDHDRRVVRGGAWYDHDSGTSCGYAMGYFAADPTFGYREVGFRCCRDESTPPAPPPGGQSTTLMDPNLRYLGESTDIIAFEIGGLTAPEAPEDGQAHAEDVEAEGDVQAQRAQRLATERDVQTNRAGCPRDMVRAGDVCIDIFEYPNKIGEIPQANLTASLAADICASQERRLCTAEEWMNACMGPEKTRWPYGDEYDRGACNYGYTGGRGGVVPSGSNSECVSGYGVYDMSGNLWEWVSDLDAEGKAQIYGGYWNLGATYGKCNTVASASMTFSHMSVGLRCCRDPIGVPGGG